MVVHRFSGKVLLHAEAWRAAADILLRESRAHRVVAILPPALGMEGFLDELIHQALRTDPSDKIRQFHRRHLELAQSLGLNLAEELQRIAACLEDLAHGVHLVRHCTERTRDGMQLLMVQASCAVMRGLLSQLGGESVTVLDGEVNLVVARAAQPYPRVDWEETRSRIQEWARGQRGIVLMSGLLAQTPQGQRINLGRNGEDYTASLIAAALSSPSVTVWLDEDGLPLAPPDLVDQPKRIRQISYEEAMEMAYFGSDVLHPYTMLPLVRSGVPLRVKDLYHPEKEGTLVLARPSASSASVSAITCIRDISLLNIEGGGMVGIPGFAARVFGALSSRGVNVIMISQASSEHSICLAIRSKETGTAVRALEEELEAERKEGQIRPLEILQPCAILAVIGDRMRGLCGLSARVFGALGRQGVNVLAIAQGSSERNISLAVAQSDCRTGVHSLYEEFFGG